MIVISILPSTINSFDDSISHLKSQLFQFYLVRLIAYKSLFTSVVQTIFQFYLVRLIEMEVRDEYNSNLISILPSTINSFYSILDMINDNKFQFYLVRLIAPTL